jgi:hypothetical protein
MAAERHVALAGKRSNSGFRDGLLVDVLADGEKGKQQTPHFAPQRQGRRDEQQGGLHQRRRHPHRCPPCNANMSDESESQEIEKLAYVIQSSKFVCCVDISSICKALSSKAPVVDSRSGPQSVSSMFTSVV